MYVYCIHTLYIHNILDINSQRLALALPFKTHGVAFVCFQDQHEYFVNSRGLEPLLGILRSVRQAAADDFPMTDPMGIRMNGGIFTYHEFCWFLMVKLAR